MSSTSSEFLSSSKLTQRRRMEPSRAKGKWSDNMSAEYNGEIPEERRMYSSASTFALPSPLDLGVEKWVLVIEELQSKNCECEGRALDRAYTDGRKGVERNRRADNRSLTCH